MIVQFVSKSIRHTFSSQNAAVQIHHGDKPTIQSYPALTVEWMCFSVGLFRAHRPSVCAVTRQFGEHLAHGHPSRVSSTDSDDFQRNTLLKGQYD